MDAGHDDAIIFTASLRYPDGSTEELKLPMSVEMFEPPERLHLLSITVIGDEIVEIFDRVDVDQWPAMAGYQYVGALES